MLDLLLLAAGLFLLVVGGDILVRGAVTIAERLNIPPLIIGLTIVSLGTSAPELFISVQAALAGSGGLAIGNVVGSNIANVLLVLGVPALIHSTCCKESGVSRSIKIMIAISVIFMVMLFKGELDRVDGIILLILLGLFLWDQYSAARRTGTHKNQRERSASNTWAINAILDAMRPPCSREVLRRPTPSSQSILWKPLSTRHLRSNP